MNTASTPPLDSFETALLDDLKRVVATATATADKHAGGAGRRLPRRRWFVAATIAALIAVVLTMVVSELRPTPAFAVSGGVNGKVTVRVMRLEGSNALEQALADRGITADVNYLPEGTECAAGRYVAIRTPGLMLSVSADDFTVTIPAGVMGKSDIFVLSAAVAPTQNGFRVVVDFNITRGPIAPCRIVRAR